MSQGIKRTFLMAISTVLLTWIATIFLRWMAGDLNSFSQIKGIAELFKSKAPRIAIVVCYGWFYLFNEILMNRDKKLFFPVFDALGLESFPPHPPSGILETIDANSKAKLSWAASQLNRYAMTYFSLAGVLSCISMLIIYRHLGYISSGYIPTISHTGRVLIILAVGGGFWGGFIGVLVIQNSHFFFSRSELLNLLHFHYGER